MKFSNKVDIKVPALVRKKIPQLFRELQRCESKEAAPRAIETFFKSIWSLLNQSNGRGQNEPSSTMRQRRHIYESIKAYFNREWFTESWLPTFMDYNLPDGETREGTNTNNFVEAAFKHFDEVFLKHTKNHRIDNCCFAVEEFF